jgi:alpha/beta hydrolase family protein
MAASLPAAGRPAPHHAAEAEKMLNGSSISQAALFSENPPGPEPPNAPPALPFLFNFEVGPAQMRFTTSIDFEFPSSVPSPWAENNKVFGKLWRAGSNWARCPSVILLHGWNAEFQYRWQFPRLAARLARAGVNTTMFELPYHGRRRPRAPGAMQDFISYDLPQMLEAVRQSLADTQALANWLALQGSPSVGLWGVSLGAWLAGLLICAPDAQTNSARVPHQRSQTGAPGRVKPGFGVLLTPIARVDQAIEDLAFCKSIRHSLRLASSVRLEPLNLASHAPAIPREKILIVASEYDLFAPLSTVDDLWQAWRKPDIWRVPQGHISVLLSRRTMRRIANWIAHKATGGTG